MIINFKSIEIENFMSMEHCFVELSDLGFVKVMGANNYVADASVSNGSGKSTIWESIIWCLTGTTIRGAKDIIRHGSNGTYVYLNFVVDNNQYKLIRSKNHDKYKTTLLLYKNEVDISGKGIRETEKLLSECLPELTKDLLCSVVILGQGMPQKFSDNTPSKRKELLEQLTHSDFMIEDLKNKVTKRKLELQAYLTELHELSAKDNSALNFQKQEIETEQRKLNDLNSIDVSQLTLLKGNLETDDATLQALLAEQGCLAACIADKNEIYQKEKDKQINETSELKELHNNSISELGAELTAINSRISYISSEITKLENVKDVCPTCGQHIPDIVIVDTSEKHKELQEIMRLREKLNTDIKALKDSNVVAEAELTNKFSFLQEFLTEMKQKESELTCVKNKISVMQHEMQEAKITLAKLEEQQLSRNTHVAELEKSIKLRALKCDSLNNSLASNEEKVNSYTQHLQVISKFETLLKRDFRGYLLQNSIEYLSDAAKRYANIVLCNDNINIYIELNEIVIELNGKEIESLSGGERQKVDLIVQFAIRELLSTYFNFNSNILVLDEIFDNLDEKGCESIISLVLTLPVNSVFIVSHRKDLDIPFDNEISVIKNTEGISTLL